MRRAQAYWLIVVAVCGLLWLPLDTARAEQCKYCASELDPDENPLHCDECAKIAESIRRANERVWVLGFKQGELGRVQIKDDTGDTETYWFLPYTITNRDDTAHEFFLDVEAVSDRGRSRDVDPLDGREPDKAVEIEAVSGRARNRARYHDTWIPDVYEEIRRVLGLREQDQLLSQRELSLPPGEARNELPKPEDRRTTATAKIALQTIQPGETLRCVAIMGPIDPEMDKLVVHVRGLTNSSLLEHDDYVAPDGEPHRRVIKEAVLTLHYGRPGDEFVHGQDPIKFEGRRWMDVKRVIASDLR